MKSILFTSRILEAKLAVLDKGLEAQTRRTYGLEKINEEPDKWINAQVAIIKPHYQVGDICYIKEAWGIGAYTYPKEAFIFYHTAPCKKVGWNDWLEKECPYGLSNHHDDKDMKRHSPLLMPEWAARNFVKITNVKAERLQNITEEDALREGCHPPKFWWQGYKQDDVRYHFRILWDSTKPKYMWADNPFVFCYSMVKVVYPERS